MIRYLFASLALLSALSASAQNLTLACEYRSGAFKGQIISVSVNYAANAVYWASDKPEPAEITERYITVARAGGMIGRRIDRTTGIVAFDTGNGMWDATVFSAPGLVCQPQKGF